MFGYFCVKKRIGVTALLLFLVVAAIRVPQAAQYDVMNRRVQKAQYCICIDSGHGGNDPGKIGVAGTKEKEVNLAIALKLKKSLEKQNIRTDFCSRICLKSCVRQSGQMKKHRI